MKHWTTQAEQRLGEYLKDRTAREGFEGEDAAELKEDLTRHIHEEAELTEGDTVGLMQLENVLGRLDAGYQPIPVKPRRGWVRKSGPFLSWTFGVVLPVIVLLVEALTSFCGSVFFSPVPTAWHVALVAAVPVVNAWMLRGGRGAGAGIQGAAAGFTLVTAVFYGLLFLPLIHVSVIALILLGMGLLSLGPILAAVASWRIGRKARLATSEPGHFRTGWRYGALAAVAVLVALEGPALWTRGNLSATSGDEKMAEAAISRLRWMHSERTLLKACYEITRNDFLRTTDISGWILYQTENTLGIFGARWNGPDSEAAREVFFRVTGKPFNSIKPPEGARGNRMTGRRDVLEGVEFDDHLGGDDVAMRVKDLDLADSRFDGHVDAVSRIGYGEWTMVFKNSSRQEREARCQVKLPRDGRVSRLTLWVNGEPREAAFSTVSKVKAAYK
ncbi:MAG: hypothetical protein EOP87_11395, partial [Verrucomicrobiaceae bacterium]